MSFQDLEAGRPLSSRQNLINGKQDATQAVASGIFQINTAVSTFQRLVNTLGTPKDTPELREKLWVLPDSIASIAILTDHVISMWSSFDFESKYTKCGLTLSNCIDFSFDL